MIIRNRLREHVPIIECTTCGKIAKQSAVIELEDPALLGERRKTWQRLIKPSFNVYKKNAQKRRNKRLFYAACLQQCINKRHKLRVRHLYGIKFHESFLDTMCGEKKKKKREET